MSGEGGRGPTIWDRPDLARAYRELRGISESVRRTWGAAFRAALPEARPHRSLDLGCGTGRFTALLAETFGGMVTGIDASVTMLTERDEPRAVPTVFVASAAAALPLRDRSIDLALLSMVYHLLAPPEPAVAELSRVVRADGFVLVRTPTRELLDRVSFLPFFPGARAVDEARMPPRGWLTSVFAAAGFAQVSRMAVEQEFAATPAEAYEKVRRRAFSTLQLISDEQFAEGLVRYEAFCRNAPPKPLTDLLELFVFRRS